MSDLPWEGDACSLVDAYRSGERSPLEELEATLAAIDASELNCVTYVDADAARAAAAAADVSLPFGGVPTAIKELEPVAGWPHSHASLVFADRIASYSSNQFGRLTRSGGAVPVAQTAASEFGGLNVSVTKLHGVTHNPWRHGCTVGGSSGGSAAAVAGGLVSLATGSDGGGSIRIPAGYCGLLGMKGTFGRITRGPFADPGSQAVVLGSLARSVRDAARFYDVCAGPDPHDPASLPDAGPWEARLGTHDLAGKKVAVVPALGGAHLEPGVEDTVRAAAADLISTTGMVEVDVDVDLPALAAVWMMDGQPSLVAALGERWPSCAHDMTDAVAMGLRLSETLFNIHTVATAREAVARLNAEMADAFAAADFIVSATNPGIAFPADAALSAAPNRALDLLLSNPAARFLVRQAMAGVRIAGAVFPKAPAAVLDLGSRLVPDVMEMGALTMLSNLHGNPAISIPAGSVDGLPVGMQVLAPHHGDALLFDVALAVERERPWPLVAPHSITPRQRLPTPSRASSGR